MQSNPHHKPPTGSTVDAQDVARFSQLAQQWWDPYGPFKPLHDISPLRIGYIRDQWCQWRTIDPASREPLAGIRALDVGCGGGLVAEPLTRLGATLTGIDASEKNIGVAATHAGEQGLDIAYLAETAETHTGRGQCYDLVTALEIVEHVADVELFLQSLSALTRPGGMLILTTINRTLKSLLMAKIGAEYILRWLPIGTHSWQQFVRPSELVLPLEALGFDKYDLTGMRYHPLSRQWSLDDSDTDVNYLLTMTRRS